MACMLLSLSVCDVMRNVTQIADNYIKYVNVAEDEKCMHVAISSVCGVMRNVTQIADTYLKYVNVAED